MLSPRLTCESARKRTKATAPIANAAMEKAARPINLFRVNLTRSLDTNPAVQVPPPAKARGALAAPMPRRPTRAGARRAGRGAGTGRAVVAERSPLHTAWIVERRGVRIDTRGTCRYSSAPGIAMPPEDQDFGPPITVNGETFNIALTELCLLAPLRRTYPWIEQVITDAEVRFRDQELDGDWAAHPVQATSFEAQRLSPLPPYWSPGIERAGRIAVAYSQAQAQTATDPVKFEQFIEDVLVAVAATTVRKKLDEYARVPPELQQRVIDQFTGDVRAATKREMKKLQQDVWKRRLEQQAESEYPPPTPAIDLDPTPASAVRKKRRRTPHPDPESLLEGKDAVTYETAAQVLGVSVRRVRELVMEQKLKARGKGHQKKIDVLTLLGHLGYE